MTFSDKRILGIHYLERRFRPEGWQFAVNGWPSKFFLDTKFGDANGSLAAASKYREQFFADHPEAIKFGRLPGLVALQKNNRTGIPGINYSDKKKNESDQTYANFQTTFPRPNQPTKPFYTSKGTRKASHSEALLHCVKFRRSHLLEYAQSREEQDEVKEMLHGAAGELKDLESELTLSIAKGEESPLIEIILSNHPAPDKQSMIRQRLGQATFRRIVLEDWDYRCAVSGTRILVEAAHIKPYSKATEIERTYPFNGLPLAVHYHEAFDAGFVTFDAGGKLQHDSKWAEDLTLAGINLNGSISGLCPERVSFLEWHSENVYEPQLRRVARDVVP